MKSFSALTKEELYTTENNKRCCDSAELAGMLLFGGNISHNEIRLVTESSVVLYRCAELCRGLGIEGIINDTDTLRKYVVIKKKEDIDKILNGFGLLKDNSGEIIYRIDSPFKDRECCRRAFIKGAFMGSGTVIDPNKTYNLEIITAQENLCRELSEILEETGFSVKTVARQSRFVIYTKQSDTIADFLTYIGAFKAQMELLNVKIEKGIRNDFNRTANIEAANIDKTITASVRQLKAIEKIEAEIGIDSMPEELQELAKLRMEYRSISLSELGKRLNPPLGKSGVNHRLNKIIGIADKLSATEEVK